MIAAMVPLANAKTENDPPLTSDASAFDEWLAGDYMLDAHGWRDEFAKETGVSFIGNYYVDVLGNPVGGQNQALRYSTLGSFGLEVDLGVATGWESLEHWSFTALGYNAEGKNLANDIGNAVQPSTLFSGVVPVGLSQLYFQYETDDFTGKVGRLTPEQYYGSSPLWDYFVSLAFNDNPWNLSASNPNFSGFPGAVWMATGSYQIDEKWNVSLGFANTSELDITAPFERGVNFDFDPAKGAMFMAEIRYNWQAELFHPQPLPGHVKVGGYYDTASVPRVVAPPPGGSPLDDGIGAAWVIIEQQFIPGKTDDDTGLTGWAAASWTGPDSVAVSPWFYSLGFVYEGILPGRPEDALAIGCGVAYMNDQLAGQNHETNIELTYMFQVTPWLTVQPDLQIILDPLGYNNIDDALVLGFQCGVTF
ncbi:carbohydrate porin [Cerasicoccus fimbriatus]|uniref:carbohydrate porin n=1 Tax=Cerasicoccus fimbriatus TaxID=3014554 RepID=UPI0022B3AD0E|nr:carbohydrate porin [Cerasicoccus sp. TK19100]